jgi:hypothetical protein
MWGSIQPPTVLRYLCLDTLALLLPWAWRKTAWEVALCAEGAGFDSCPPHGAFLWGNGIVIVRLAEWPVPVWGLSEG